MNRLTKRKWLWIPLIVIEPPNATANVEKEVAGWLKLKV